MFSLDESRLDLRGIQTSKYFIVTLSLWSLNRYHWNQFPYVPRLVGTPKSHNSSIGSSPRFEPRDACEKCKSFIRSRIPFGLDVKVDVYSSPSYQQSQVFQYSGFYFHPWRFQTFEIVSPVSYQSNSENTTSTFDWFLIIGSSEGRAPIGLGLVGLEPRVFLSSYTPSVDLCLRTR